MDVECLDRAQLRADALAAHDAGLCVIPATPDGSKQPAVKWKPFQSQRPHREQVESWFAGADHDGFGVVCGRVSGNLEAFELEGRAVDDGTYSEFDAAVRAAGLGEVFDRVTAGYFETSPSGGLHWLYRCDAVAGNMKLASRPTNTGADVWIETRGEGGFMICAPSGGRTHPTGVPWVRALGGFDSIATITSEERDGLHRVASLFDEMPAPASPRVKATRNGSGARPGDDFDARTTWPDVLEPAGWVRVYDHGTETAWRRPGKNIGISATTNHMGTDTLKVFSTSTPFPIQGTHTRFGAYAWLHHAGDMSAAARALAGQGYRSNAESWAASMGDRQHTSQPRELQPSELALPDTFWNARPAHAHIRQAAHAQGVSAEAVLGVVCARVAAASPHTIEIPGIVVAPCGLSLFVALTGHPGASKSGAERIGRSLVPHGVLDPACDGLVPGSGEGLIELMFETVTEPDPAKPDRTKNVKRQTHWNAYLYADEAETVFRQTNRQSGSTILTHARSIFTSGPVGAANAAQETRRHLDGGSYVYGIVFGIQPQKAEPLFSDAGGGTPQRFLWCSAGTPIPPLDNWPDHPGPLGWSPPDPDTLETVKVARDGRFRHPVTVENTVAREVRENYMHRREHGCDPLDQHHDLVRLKIAAVLALLEHRLAITTDDWHLAGLVTDTSRAVRGDVLATLAAEGRQIEQARRDRDAGREIHKADALHGHLVVETAQLLATNVRAEVDWRQAPSQLYRRLSTRRREVFHEALGHAIEHHWVQITEEPSHTNQPKRSVQPGTRKPPS